MSKIMYLDKEYCGNTLKYFKDAPDNGSAIGNAVINDTSDNVASGGYATAEGKETIASGVYSHAEGWNTEALGASSHAEGTGSQSIGNNSHAGGNYTQAVGTRSFAMGDFNIAQGDDQTVLGKFNEPKNNYALLIGGGSSENVRLNILEFDWDGNMRTAGFVNEVLIYDKTQKLLVPGTIGSGKDDANGLINQNQGEGANRDITSWNIEGMDLSKFRRLRIVYRRTSDTLGSTGEFYLPIEGDTIPTRNVYQSGATAPAHCNRNRLNTVACAVSGDKTKFCVTQTFSLYGTAATTISDLFVERIYGCY